MKRIRVGRKIDAQRVAQLVSMPGIDPRIWVSLCIVDKVVIDDDGVFADVHIMSTATTDDDGNVVAQTETVRVAPDYAGSGFGFFFPPEEGDEVLVTWPDGEPDHGGILVKRLWSTSDPPPDVAKNNPGDAVLVVKKDANLRIVMQGQGNCILTVDSGKVLLGDENGTASVIREGDAVDMGTWTHAPASGSGVTPCKLTWVPPGGGTSVVDPVAKELDGKAKHGSDKVESA